MIQRLSIRNTEKQKRDLARLLVPWVLNHICGPRLAKLLDITIISKDIYNNKTYTQAECEWIDDNNAPREFIITIDSKCNLKTFALSLTHELVHVKQYAKKQLFSSHKAQIIYWQGDKVDESTTNYWELPWEIEAYGRQLGLLVQFCTANKDKYKVPRSLF